MRTSMIKNSFSSTTDELKFKFILVGDSAVGKSALFLKFLNGDSQNYAKNQVTMIDFGTKEVFVPEERQSVKLFIWDTAGQERYRCIVSTYFKGCHGALLVFDLSEPKTFQNLKSEWFPILKRKAEDAIIILIGNKSDLQQKVSEQDIAKFAKQNKLFYIKTSVKDNSNVNEAFQKLTRMVNRNRNSIERPNSFCIKKRSENLKKRNCCLFN